MDSQGPLNATAAAMLGLLAQLGPINGNALSRCADVLIGDYWSLTRSQVYRELRTLEQLTYITAGAAGPRSSREFSITSDGESALRAWLMSELADDVVRMPILLIIRFGQGLPASRLGELLSEFASRHRAKHDYYLDVEQQLLAAGADPFELATLRFGMLFEGAVESWLAELPGLLPIVFDAGGPAA